MADTFPGHRLRPNMDVDEPGIRVGKVAHTPWYSRIFVGGTYERHPLRTVATVAIAVFAAGSALTYGLVNGVAERTVSGNAFAATVPAPSYSWAFAGYDGGGRADAIAMDQRNPGHAAIGGDVWGEFTTADQANSWTPRMWGINGIGFSWVRAVAYSKKYPGVAYWGIGTLSGLQGSYVGAFGTTTTTDYQMRLNTSFGFASAQSGTRPAALTPRAVGRLITVDYNKTTNTEYVYALSNKGLVRSTDGGKTFTVLGLASVPEMAWKAMVRMPDGSLYVADYGIRTSDTAVSNQQVWRITAPRGKAKVTSLSGVPGPVNDLAVINGSLWDLTTTGVYRLSGGAWQQMGGSFFSLSGLVLSSIDGVGSTIYVGMADAPSGDYIAKSSDGGATWAFVTQAPAIQPTVLGTDRTWFLNGHGLPDRYGTEQLAVDPNNPNFVVSAGFRGAYATQDGGQTWYPASNGFDGSEVSHLLAGDNGQAWNDDTDWAQPTGTPFTSISTNDHYSSVQGSRTVISWPTPALSRTVNGVSYSVVKGKPYDITMDGTSIASDFFRAAMTNPTDIEVGSDGYIYIAQYGGGVLVGTPH